MIYLKLVLVFLWLCISCTLGLIASIFRWGDRNLDRDFARIFSKGILGITGIRVELEGREHLESSQPCIYVANHQSGFDMATFGTLYPQQTVVIGKKELKWIPFFGMFFVASGNILIDRKKRIQAIAGLGQAVSAIHREKVSIWIFPEGTRNKKGVGLLPFKKGAFHMAIEAGVPVVPILSASLLPIISWKERKLIRGTVQIRVLPPISTQGMKSSDVDQLCDSVREKMLEALHGLSTIPTGSVGGLRSSVKPSSL